MRNTTMKYLWLAASVLVVVFFASSEHARAEGELYRTPPEGASAEYALHLEITDDGRTESRDATIVISSVGRTQENGVDCRWIEAWANIEAQEEIWKALVPEEYLTGDQNAAAYVRRYWHQRGNNEPEQIMPSDRRFEQQLGPIVVFLGGPLDDVEQLEPEEIDVPGLGTLVCEHEAGTMTIPLGPNRRTIDAEVWRSDQAPFGSVRMVLEAESPDGQQPALRVELDLVGVGSGAESRLPNSN